MHCHSTPKRRPLAPTVISAMKGLTALTALTTFASAAHADDAELHTLDESVVSAAGYAQDTRDAPASVSVISGKELEAKPVADLAEAIEDVPGVDIEQTKMGGHTIRLRGFDSKYTLVLIDGKRQNVDDGFVKNGFDPQGNFLPPAAAIERIEVLRGPASTVYGSDAVGGVVNIITKKYPDRLTGSITLEGTLQQHDDLYGNSFGTNVYLATPIKEDTASLQLRGRYLQRSASGLKTPNGAYASHSPSEGFTGTMGGRLTFTVNDANSFYVDGDLHRFKGGSMSTSSAGTKSLWYATKTNVVLAHQGKYSIGETETYFQYGGLENTSAEDRLETANYILSTKLVSPVDLGDFGAMNLSSGLEYWYDTFRDDSSADGSKLDANKQPVNSDIAGKKLDHTQISGFLESEYFINETWSTTLGARLTWSDIFGTHVAPRGYVVWKPSHVISFKGGVAGGYKTPAVKELTDGVFEVNGSSDGYYPRYGNSGLKPEESWNYELSTDIRLGEIAALTVTGFYTDFKNKIDYETEKKGNTTVSQTRINIGKVEAKGVEVGLRTMPVYGVSFTGSYTYTESKVKTPGAANYNEPVSSLPKHVISAKVDYEDGAFNTYLRMRAKLDTPNVGSKTGTVDKDHPKYNDFLIFDLGAGYRFNKNHRVAFVVNNLFDRDYNDWYATTGKNGISYSNLYRDYEEGRSLWASYTYDF